VWSRCSRSATRWMWRARTASPPRAGRRHSGSTVGRCSRTPCTTTWASRSPFDSMVAVASSPMWRCGIGGGTSGRTGRPIASGVRLDRSERPALRGCHGGRQRSSPPRLAGPAPPLPKMPWSAPVSGIGRYDGQYHSRG
jgi:hypothetical protein